MKMRAQMLAAELRRASAPTQGVDAILRDIQQLESVVRDLIELARPGELRREPTSVTRLMDDVLEQLSAQLLYRKIVVRRELAEALPPVSLDAARFRQVLLNVIGNAADAMHAGGVLTVHTQLDADRLVLDIIDDGAGIDPAIRDRLFDPFVSTKRDGVGLGLVNAKAVVEQHGGRIELGPGNPRGTQARIVLPIAAGETLRS
jgi:signal transduction histidine kinase